jgi:hypothetical protein
VSVSVTYGDALRVFNEMPEQASSDPIEPRSIVEDARGIVMRLPRDGCEAVIDSMMRRR